MNKVQDSEYCTWVERKNRIRMSGEKKTFKKSGRSVTSMTGGFVLEF